MLELTRAQESRAAIERLYVVMRHLFNRGYYKPGGASGQAIKNDLLVLSPEIYGSMKDQTKVELDGLVYVIDRLPKGIEECRFIKLVSEEGYEKSTFNKIIPSARRRNCYRVDRENMLIEVTRGRSEIYDVLTHLTFLYLEADKIVRNAQDSKKRLLREWQKLEEIVTGKEKITTQNEEIAFTYLSTILGRTFDETKRAHARLVANDDKNNGLFHIVYWLGKVALNEFQNEEDREITFSPTLRARIGHHIYGEQWANKIKGLLHEHNLLERPIHIVSANLHSVMNSLYAYAALKEHFGDNKDLIEIVSELSKTQSAKLRKEIENYALQYGMYVVDDDNGTHITAQIFDLEKVNVDLLPEGITANKTSLKKLKPVIILMDYAFGEQAFETMDELLKPFEDSKKLKMNVESISIMGKAGILHGGKGDLMIPTAHIFEGTADNYPFENDLTKDDFKDVSDLQAFEGPMITVLGTSLQNKDILAFLRNSSWGAIGLEMEGAHYQKAIQAASKIRKNIKPDVTLRYAYYASDNPLQTGHTLASGSLGMTGVKPTYAITLKILEKILTSKA
ncbi:DUF6909 family protein [Sediminitomix flava]|uniref:Uncharacterized protein n=1 Tax=Sediminitomix flava TaxID=379075 RepID=A0A315ZCQ0_SEDFL|nr:hypothetical protein [Sediminitomix flava]PWJ42598.1 hypothetical protein BC781_102142 [Sediminitomix flava]